MIDAEHEEPPMSEQHPATAPAVPDGVEQPEVIPPGELAMPVAEEASSELESIESPAKVMRVGSMVKQLLDEVRAAPLDEAATTLASCMFLLEMLKAIMPCGPSFRA